MIPPEKLPPKPSIEAQPVKPARKRETRKRKPIPIYDQFGQIRGNIR